MGPLAKRIDLTPYPHISKVLRVATLQRNTWAASCKLVGLAAFTCIDNKRQQPELVVGYIMSDYENETSDDSLEVVPSPPTLREQETRVSIYYDSKEADGGVVGKVVDTEEEEKEEEEDEDAYRLRVYGTADFIGEPRGSGDVGLMRKFSQRFSRQMKRQRASVVEQLPETPQGWTVLLSVVGASILGYEMNLQSQLTQPPYTFGQIPEGTTLSGIHAKMTATADSILSRSIQPSLFVGTRGLVSSTAAYLMGGPNSTEEHLRFRDVLKSPIDGATFGVDWEVPWRTDDPRTSKLTALERTKEILDGPIREPVVIILHGINNDASFGYMKSLQRSFAKRGWNAAAMNFRGCGGVPLTTPRGYNGSYTGDLRSLVWVISGRVAENVPVFLVGNSLGASIMTKYLGEEGLSGTLPKCVAGAASLGGPLVINSSRVSFPFNIVMALGIKTSFLKNISVFSKMRDPMFRSALRKGWLSTTIGNVDRAVAPIIARNDPFYPFAFRIGFKSGDSYWTDGSCYRLIRYISVPYLNLTAEDDFLVATPNKNKLGFCIANPNVMVAETRCGGHLGWQESPPETDSAFGATSWADAAAADFFDAVMKTNLETTGTLLGTSENLDDDPSMTLASRQELKDDALQVAGKMHSKL